MNEKITTLRGRHGDRIEKELFWKLMQQFLDNLDEDPIDVRTIRSIPALKALSKHFNAVRNLVWTGGINGLIGWCNKSNIKHKEMLELITNSFDENVITECLFACKHKQMSYSYDEKNWIIKITFPKYLSLDEAKNLKKSFDFVYNRTYLYPRVEISNEMVCFYLKEMGNDVEVIATDIMDDMNESQQAFYFGKSLN